MQFLKTFARSLPPAVILVLAACGAPESSGDGSSPLGGSSDDGSGGSAVVVPKGPICGASFAPMGYDVGQTLPDMVLKSCDGDDVQLSRFCDGKAMWIHVAHQWCPWVKRTSPLVEGIHDPYRSKGLVTIEVVYQGVGRAPATREDCRAWKAQHGLADAVTLYDSTGVVKALWENGKTNLSVFVDGRRVIRSKTHLDDPAVLRSKIEGALASP